MRFALCLFSLAVGSRSRARGMSGKADLEAAVAAAYEDRGRVAVRLGDTIGEIAAEKAGRPLDEVVAERAKGNPAGRFGDPTEFGDACAFLCSAQMGYVTGQHFLMDGGAFPGTF